MKTLVLAIIACVAATVAFAQSQYSIRSGDTLAVEVLEDPSLNRSLLVLPNGTITFPFAGSVQAGGQSPDAVAGAIASRISSNFASEPTVFVTVQSLRPRVEAQAPQIGPTIDVYMLGEIGAPGLKRIERGTTVLQALATSGGFTRFAATKRILLRRSNISTGEQTVSRINYKAIASGASVGSDIVLADGDVIIVPERRLFE
ncbi:polysaccharide biosynthesis/export family protein [uncultured Boseongicola sp.]|jgi:polysaccharide export outer membrane protein|uniref:polysaccharide biosynthesis/export family protein n=1 Tax=uncultured Boseongicola sp. TaxID=1648499 RepID=UPI00261B5A8F|nr:polysaccharide biosynthesis/export family protein [uncultured Boseongicola sp.]